MSSARLLILGVLRIKQPTHGYDIRRELESWRVDQWANVAYGSIYHALSRMTEEGLVEPASGDRPEKRPARVVYSITERGEQEFQRLLREYWWEPKRVVDPFQVAVTFMNAMPADELVAALRTRSDLLNAELKILEQATKLKMSPPDTPRHISENMRLAAAHVEAEQRWVEEAIEKVERGELP